MSYHISSKFGRLCIPFLKTLRANTRFNFCIEMNFKILILISVLSFNEYAHSATLSNSETSIKDTEDKITTDLLENGKSPSFLEHQELILADNLSKPEDKVVKLIEPLALAKSEAEVTDPLPKEVIITPTVAILKPAEEKLLFLQKTTEPEPETLKSLLSSEKAAEISEKVAGTFPAAEVATEVVKEATSDTANPTVDLELAAAELKSELVDLVSSEDALTKNVASIVEEVKSAPSVVEIQKPNESSIKIGLTDTSDIPFLSSGPKITKDLQLNAPTDIKSAVKEELLEEECVKDKSPGLTAVFKDPLVTLSVPVSAPVAAPLFPSATQGLLSVNLKNLPQTPTDPTIPPQSKLSATVLQRPDFILKNPALKREEKILYVVDASKNLYSTVEGDLVRLELVRKSPEVVKEENKWVKVAPLPYPARTIITDRPKVSHTNFKYTSVPAPRRQLSEASSSTLLRGARNLRYNPFVSQNNFRRRMMMAPVIREPNVQLPYYNQDQDDICSYEDTQPGGRCFLFVCYDMFDRPYLC